MVADNSLLVLLLLKFSKIFVQMKKSSCIMAQKLFFILFTTDIMMLKLHPKKWRNAFFYISLNYFETLHIVIWVFMKSHMLLLI